MSTARQHGPPAAAARAPTVPATRHRTAVGGPAAIRALQRTAGNAAVTAAIQRYAEPARPAGTTAAQDPRFRALEGKVRKEGAALKSHPPAAAEARKAQDAAEPPSSDKEAQAKAAQADTMAGARPGGFDKAAFIAAVKQAIAAKSPNNLDEADKFAESGKAGEVKAEVAGKVADGKQKAAGDVTAKTEAPPDPSRAVEKPVTPLAPEPQPAPGAVPAAAAMPAKAPPEQTDLSGGPAAADAKMKDAGVTEEQLANSNEPEFTGALEAKAKGEEHSATAPKEVRATEDKKLAGVKKSAAATAKSGLVAMLAGKKAQIGKAVTEKNAAKVKEEQERARVTQGIQSIFDETKTAVTAILDGLDTSVAQRFDAGEKTARAAFTQHHKREMAAYKDRRYSGLDGAALWLRDQFASLPEEVNRFYEAAKRIYEQRMEVCISQVADHIGTELTRAKDRISEGRSKIQAYVAQQPASLRKFAGETAGRFNEQFDQLENDVDSKRESLVDDLATRYDESRQAVDAEITAMQEENKGLWDKAVDAVAGAVETVLKLKDMLLGVLARAAGAVEKIIKDPIGFLGNFVGAVKAGITGFAANIVEHLKTGLKGWLFGALASAGIELPEKFDLPGVVKLVLSILGLTWAGIRARIVKHIPEPVMDKVEKGVEFIKVVVDEGIGGIWKWVLEKVGDVKAMVMEQIQDFVVTKIIKAGITWLISLLNPAAAFIKACKMIYDVVMFFVEKGAQLKEFVDSVLDSVESIAGGGVGAVAGLIEKALARTLPLVLGFLASLLGLGGISEKIKSILQTIQKPVMQVVDKLVAGAVKYGKKFLKGLKNLGKKALGKLGFGKDKDDPRSEAVKAKARAKVGEQTSKPFTSRDELQSVVTGIQSELRPEGLRSLTLSEKRGKPGSFDIVAVASPADPVGTATVQSPSSDFDAEGLATQGTAMTQAAVAASLDAQIEQAFREYDGPPANPAFPVTRRPPAGEEKRQAREEFGPLRGKSVDPATGQGSGYAGVLGVKPGGQVHHAIELQALSLYPGVFTATELNALDNMRGIPPEGVPPGEIDKVTDAVKAEMERKKQLHNSKIREVWNHKYNALDREITSRALQPGTPEYRSFVRAYLTECRKEIDHLYGPFFSEQRAQLVWELASIKKSPTT